MLRHTGIVKEIMPTSLIVTIINESACAACHAKGVCTLSGSREKEIIITKFRDNYYRAGANVVVVARESQGVKALTLGYLLPFFLLVIFLFLALSITGDEIRSAFIALGILIPYYIILYLLKDKLKKNIEFELDETWE
ncbi:MAG: SoxR reducing system RseC family protein [Prolixibacteraceae bacterium]|nr:SoxR reducing system RseC family protein [Prolixibacteraceae bacterium]